MSNSALTLLVVVLALCSAWSRWRSASAPSAAGCAPARRERLPAAHRRRRAARRGRARCAREAGGALRHLAVVRYDAFGDMGGRLSWSLALVDEAGNGIVLTSIHGRCDARTYAKDITAWASDQPLSPEEQEASSGQAS